MRGHGRTLRGTRRFTGTAFGALTLCAAFALTGCNGNGDDGADATGPAPATTAPVAAPPAAPSAAAPTVEGVSKAPTKPSASATAPGKPKPPAPGPACSHKPVSADEIAVDRYTPEGGFTSLIVKHGAWGCPGAGGKTSFETVGEETFIPIAEDAKITAVSPILPSAVSKPITLHELTSWLESHPDKGLVFHYHLGAKGEIDTLGQEEYLP
ncbi:hypothetical protein AB0N28_15710 [Streptomyces sp. NPDC051130]|uniref:hypothetical protein n=1 Tax=Streptomyces sp. NPDC051130 TaxID=3157223 RepID=UPI00343F633F